MSNINSLSLYLPELIIITTLLLIIILDLIPSTRIFTFPLSLVSLAFSAIMLWKSYGITDSLFMGMICIDPFSHFFKYIFLFTTFSIILISRYEKKLDRSYSAEYNTLLLIVLLGLFLMSSSINLIMIYLSIELVSIPSYILAGMLKTDKESNEASLKYVIFGSFASGLMLFGLSLLYGIVGTTEVVGINQALQQMEYPLTIYFPLILILVGFGYKISMVPFHYWTPDVYEGAATPVTAFFSVAPKAAGLSILIRFFYTVFTNDSGFNSTSELLNVNWTLIIAALSALTMTIGNLLALYQQNVKRMLAYSSISHIGFILIVFCV
jgi:NADH-quinone oxidoreductase subunit N